MPETSHISGHDWWNWRGKTEALLQAHDHEIDDLRRGKEAGDQAAAARLEQLAQIIHRVRESMIGLELKIESLTQRLDQFDKRLDGSWPGLPPLKSHPLSLICGSLMGGASGLILLAYALAQLGKAFRWW